MTDHKPQNEPQTAPESLSQAPETVVSSEINGTSTKTKAEAWRAAKFVMFSASAGVIEIAVFALMNELLELPYWPCYLTALVCSVLWNFTMNRNFTFRAANNVPVAMFKVFCYYLVFTPLTTIGGNYLAETLGWNEYLVTAINMLLNITTEYLYQRFFVFGRYIDSKVKN